MMRKFTPKKRTGKSLSGYKSKKNGQSAEDQVEETAKYYLSTGQAEINKRYEPYKRIGGGGSGGIFKAVYKGKSGCDYALYLPDGRAGMIEVKSREADRIYISVIDEMQKEQLKRRYDWDQLALILVRMRGEWYLVSYFNWYFNKNGESYSRKSHSIKQLSEIGMKIHFTTHLDIPFTSI